MHLLSYIYYLIIWGSEFLKSMCRHGIPSGNSEGDYVSCPFQLLEVTHIPWLVALPAMILHWPAPPSHLFLCFHGHTTCFLWSSCFPCYKNVVTNGAPLENSESSPHLKILHLILSAKSSLPCQVPYSQLPRLRTWASLRRGIFLSTRRGFATSHLLAPG